MVVLSWFDWTSGQRVVAGRVAEAYRGVAVAFAVDYRLPAVTLSQVYPAVVEAEQRQPFAPTAAAVVAAVVDFAVGMAAAVAVAVEAVGAHSDAVPIARRPMLADWVVQVDHCLVVRLFVAVRCPKLVGLVQKDTVHGTD